jgi:D-tagatose-1,6-bisphosphate aldolase subunit GatZ/KbaZ
MVFEAHSTDYQTRDALRTLVKDHFAILKVGPGLTFAMREALWALDAIDQELLPEHQQARLRDTVLERMREQPKYWERYYHGAGKQLTVDLQYSLSDRVRYYWPDPVIENARLRLFDNLRSNPPPISLLSQHLPLALHAVREGAATRDPLSLAVAQVSAVLDDYHHACHTH